MSKAINQSLFTNNCPNFSGGKYIYVYISGLDLESTPQLFYTYFYNHAHRLRLEKLL